MYKKLKAEQLAARKAKHADRASLIVGVIADVDLKVLPDRKLAESKGDKFLVPDTEVIATLKNQIKNLNKSIEDITAKVGHCDAIVDLTDKVKALEKFLPQKIEGDDLRILIQGLEADNLGKSMKELKALSASVGFVYDGKEAASIAKDLFL